MPHRSARPAIDGFQFAETGSRLCGAWPVAGFERLRDSLASRSGQLDYDVLGIQDEAGQHSLRIKVSGAVQLTCQRCLTALPFALRIDALVLLARNEAEIEAQPVDPEGPDRVVASREMDVGALLEDEIILTLPLAPRHEHCSGASTGKGDAKASPFANLRGMLGQGGRAKS